MLKLQLRNDACSALPLALEGVHFAWVDLLPQARRRASLTALRVQSAAARHLSRLGPSRARTWSPLGPLEACAEAGREELEKLLGDPFVVDLRVVERLDRGPGGRRRGVEPPSPDVLDEPTASGTLWYPPPPLQL